MTPGGSTVIEPSRVEGLLPGFREAMADGLSWSLWLVTGVTILATVVAWAGFRWQTPRDLSRLWGLRRPGAARR